MADELRQRMARLRELAPRLNAATDQASKLVAVVEKFLVEELRIGVSAEVVFDDAPAPANDADPTIRLRQALGFARCSGAFRVHVVQQTVDVDPSNTVEAVLTQERILWPSCPRETKLKAFEKLPELLDAIIATAERLADAAATTEARVSALLDGALDLDPSAATPGDAQWTPRLDAALKSYLARERDVVEAETDGEAWETRMEAEGRDDADPHSEFESARNELLRLVIQAHGFEPKRKLKNPVFAQLGAWLVLVAPGRDEPWDDDDRDSRRLFVVPQSAGKAF